MKTRLAGCAAVMLAGVAILTGCTAPRQAPTETRNPISTPTAEVTRSAAVAAQLQDAVFARLPEGARTAPSLTWQDPKPGTTGNVINTDGKYQYLAAACHGNGIVTVTVSGLPDKVLNCQRLISVGPIDITPTGDGSGGITFDVTVTSGAPQYFAKMVVLPSKATAS